MNVVISCVHLHDTRAQHFRDLSQVLRQKIHIRSSQDMAATFATGPQPTKRRINPVTTAPMPKDVRMSP
jgi:hypothetical protein